MCTSHWPHSRPLSIVIMKRLAAAIKKGVFLSWPLWLVIIPSFANVIHVPGDQPTIQAGINAASNGDTVLVAPGTYSENIDFLGKAITVKSSGGASVTVIDGGQLASVVTFQSGETPAAVITGFTIQNGLATNINQIGGGIAVLNGSSPTITNNMITLNQACVYGYGIGIYGYGSPIITNNLITDNSVLSTCEGGGGGAIGITASGGNFQIVGNTIFNNTGSFGGGGISINNGSGTIANNVINGNTSQGQGGGISLVNLTNDVSIVQNLIYDNMAPMGSAIYWSNAPGVLADNTIIDSAQSSGGATIEVYGFSGLQAIENNIIVASVATYAIQCDYSNFPANSFSFNDAFSSHGTPYGGMCTNQSGMNGNISADPKFVPNGFQLQSNSPAIDVGNNSGPNLPGADIANNPRVVNGTGVASAVVDMGAYEYFPSPIQWVSIAPCRLVDTRGPNGPFGGPALSPGVPRSFAFPSDPNCPIPTTALAYSLNVTVVPSGHLGYLTIWPTGPTQPLVSTMNSADGRTKANAALVEAGNSEAVSVFATDATNVIIDIDGYFTAPESQTLQFYPLTPCRVVDTRGTNGDLGGPYLMAQVERDFPVLESSCLSDVLGAQAYSMNVTVVPHPSGQPLGYLTVWPQGEMQPEVSTLNNPTATVVANAAIVSAGTGGSIAVYPYNSTDLIVDINGYFAAPELRGFSFYPVAPCRAFDSRNNNGQSFTGQITVPISGSPCAPPAYAAAYVFSATVVPSPLLPYLTLWPYGEQEPVVSTLNAYDGFITSNMAIVPNVDGSTDAYAGDGYTQLILDILGYFAQ